MAQSIYYTALRIPAHIPLITVLGLHTRNTLAHPPSSPHPASRESYTCTVAVTPTAERLKNLCKILIFAIYSLVTRAARRPHCSHPRARRAVGCRTAPQSARPRRAPPARRPMPRPSALAALGLLLALAAAARAQEDYFAGG